MTAFNQPPTPELRATGDCYTAAFQALTELAPEDAFLQLGIPNDAQPRLVHGRPRLRSDYLDSYPRYGHAWIEVCDVVIDRSNGGSVVMPRRLYYALGDIEESSCHRYTIIEATKALMDYKHLGPWDGPHGHLPIQGDAECDVDALPPAALCALARSSWGKLCAYTVYADLQCSATAGERCAGMPA